MTSIAIWKIEGDPGPSLWAVSDSRISNVAARSASDTLLNEAPKIFELPIGCFTTPPGGGFFNTRYFSQSIGLAYAGNALLGLNLYPAIVPLLSNLASTERYIPTLREVAEFVANFLRHLTASRNLNVPRNLPGSRPLLAEAAIFGYCFAEKRLRVLHLTPVFEPDLEIEVREQDVDPPELLLLGDQKGEIQRAIEKRRAAVPAQSLHWWRMPKRVIEEVIEDDAYPTIGGALQLAIVTERGFIPHAVTPRRRAGRAPSALKYLGLDVWDDFGKVGECRVNLTGMG